MKRVLIAFGLLIVLSLGLMAGVYARADMTRDRVELRREALYGDPSAADGLRVTFHMTAGDDLNWTTAVTLGGGEPETVFFRGRPDVEGYMWSSWDMDAYLDMFSCLLEEGVRADDGHPEEYMDMTSPFSRAVLDVMRRTEVGQRRREVVSLADYTDCVPLNLTVYWERLRGYSSSGWNQAELNELFRVPVKESYYLSIEVTRTEDEYRYAYGPTDAWSEPVTEPAQGETTDRSALPEPGMNGDSQGPADLPEGCWDGFFRDYLNFTDACNDSEGIWIVPSFRTQAGEELLACRDGPGVYYLPRVRLERNENGVYVSDRYVDPDGIDFAGARLLYGTSARPVYLRLGADGESLHLYTLEQGRLWLTVLDAATGEERQRLDLIPLEDATDFILDRGDKVLICAATGDLVLVTEREGVCQAALTTWVDREKSFDYFSLRNAAQRQSALAWDGERLALAEGLNGYLFILDASGLRSVTRYELSPLWDGPTGFARMDNYAAEPMELAFT